MESNFSNIEGFQRGSRPNLFLKSEKTFIHNPPKKKNTEIAKNDENILDQIFSEAPSFMTIISVPDFRYLRSNAQHLKLIRKSDIIGKTILEVEPELEKQGIIQLLKNVAASGEPYVGREIKIEYEAIGNEPAKTSYLDFVYQPLRGKNGETYAIAAQGYDVTEKVLSRKAVENERENIRNLFRETPELVCILRGKNHIFEFVNESHIKMLGFDATGKSVREAQPESVEVHGILDEVFRTGVTAQLHQIPVTISDRLGLFNLTYSARRNEFGAVDGIMILGIEVTEQVNSSKRLGLAVTERTRKLRESESFLDSVIENIPNMVFVKDAKTLKFVRFNKAGEKLIGASRSDLIGKGDADFFPEEQAKQFIAKDREVLSGRSIVDIPEENIETKNLGRRILHTRKIPIFNVNGEPEYLLGISEDITEWKEAEMERLRVIREQAALGERKRETERAAFLAEASTVLASSLNYHQTLKDLARLTVPAMAVWCTVTIARENGHNERIAAVHTDPEKKRLIDELSKNYSMANNDNAGIGHVIKTGKTLFFPEVSDAFLKEAAIDHRHYEIMSELKCNSCIVVPITSRGKMLGAISLVSDKDVRQYNENDVALAEELGRRAGIAIENAVLFESAQKAIRTRDEFMSIASHELKTPLTSLKLQAQIREREVRNGNLKRFSPENISKLIKEDERQVNRLIRLVEDMLDISRINTGKLAFCAEEFDLLEMIKETASRYSPQFEASGVPLTIHANLNLVGKWDRFRLEQVFVNLLTNALKYGDSKPVEVKLEKSGSFAILKVRDEGLGISKVDQTRIFNQFERAVTGNSISGLGLGLYISKKIVEAHGGTIHVESDIGEGSTFSVKLPLTAQFISGSLQ